MNVSLDGHLFSFEDRHWEPWRGRKTEIGKKALLLHLDSIHRFRVTCARV